MNPKTLITYIDNTRADMARHVERLSAADEHPAQRIRKTERTSTAVADVLDATVAGQLSATMPRLSVLNADDERSAHEANVRGCEPSTVDLGAAEYKVIIK